MAVNELESFWKINKTNDKVASNAQLTLDQTLQNKYVVGGPTANYNIILRHYKKRLQRSQIYHDMNVYLRTWITPIWRRHERRSEYADIKLPDARPSIAPFSPCSHHHIILKFSRVITNETSDNRAKGQGQGNRGQNPI